MTTLPIVSETCRDAPVAPGIARKAAVKDGYADEDNEAGTGAADARAIAPQAVLDDARIAGKGDANMAFDGDLMSRSEAERVAESLAKGTGGGYPQTGRTVGDVAEENAHKVNAEGQKQQSVGAHALDRTSMDAQSADAQKKGGKDQSSDAQKKGGKSQKKTDAEMTDEQKQLDKAKASAQKNVQVGKQA